MGPASLSLVIVLLAGCAGLLYVLARVRLWFVKLLCGVLATALAMVAGMAEVNRHYGYYQSWSMLFADVTGAVPPGVLDQGAVLQTAAGQVQHGQLLQVSFPGARSRVDRRGLVYLPAQYSQRQFAHVRFPVIELLHGSPGSPLDWVRVLRLTQLVDELIARHLMGPAVLVMPSINQGRHYEDCVNGVAAADETYLAVDVPADVRARFRVSNDPANWAVAGYSSGGFCAANLGLRNPHAYGAVAVMDGYYLAADGPAAAALGHNTAAELAYSPLELAAHPRITGAFPAFWVSAGTGVRVDLAEARTFVAELQRYEQVPFLAVRRGHHDFYTVAAMLPRALAWSWQQIAAPDLQRLFPILGPPIVIRVRPDLPRQVLVRSAGTHAPISRHVRVPTSS